MSELESDENKTIVRLVLEKSFRDDLANDIDGTISAAGYNVSADFIQRLKDTDLSQIANSSVQDVQSTVNAMGYAECW